MTDIQILIQHTRDDEWIEKSSETKIQNQNLNECKFVYWDSCETIFQLN